MLILIFILSLLNVPIISKQKLTNWLNAVARAAPLIPILKINMKIGSSTIFKIPPLQRPIIA